MLAHVLCMDLDALAQRALDFAIIGSQAYNSIAYGGGPT